MNLGGNREVDNWAMGASMQEYIQTLFFLQRQSLESNLNIIMKGEESDGEHFSWLSHYLGKPRDIIQWYDRIKNGLTAYEK